MKTFITALLIGTAALFGQLGSLTPTLTFHMLARRFCTNPKLLSMALIRPCRNWNGFTGWTRITLRHWWIN